MARPLFAALLAGCLCAVPLIGCGGGEGDTPTPSSQEVNLAPGPAPSSIKIDAKEVDIKLVTDYWNGFGADGKPVYLAAYIITNKSQRPLASVTLKFDLSFNGHSYTTSANYINTNFRGVGSTSWRYLMPGQRSQIETYAWPADRAVYLRDDAVVKITVEDAKEMVVLPDHPEDFAQLTWLISTGNLDEIKAAFEKDKKLLDVRNPAGQGPLQFALMQKNIEVVKYLQSLGADIKETSQNNECAYHFAALSGPEMVRYVKTQGVRSTVTVNTRESAMFNGIGAGNIKTLAALKEAGVPVNGANTQGYPPLMYAVGCSEAECAEELARLGANKDFFMTDGRGLLMLAAGANGAEFFARMVKIKGSIKEVSPATGDTPLHSATNNSNTDVVQWLLLHGADPNVKNKQGVTPKDMAQGNQELLDVYKNPKKPL